MKKIVIITNHSYMLWRFRLELIQELMKDYEVVIVTPFVGHEDYFKSLGIKKGEGETLPKYIKILDFSPKGQEILNTIKKTSHLPVIKNMNGLKKESPALRDEYERCSMLDKIYSLYQGETK